MTNPSEKGLIARISRDAGATLSDFKSTLSHIDLDYGASTFPESLADIGVILLRWANSLLATFPLQPVPVHQKFSATNTQLGAEVHDFETIGGGIVLALFDRKYGEYKLPPLEKGEVARVQVMEELTEAHETLVEQVSHWDPSGAPSDKPRDLVWLFSFYLRIYRALLYELTSEISTIEAAGLLYFLRHVLPKARVERPLAAASALNLFTEISLSSTTLDSLMRGKLKRDSGDQPDTGHVSRILDSLMAEERLWRRAGFGLQAEDTLGCLLWKVFVWGGDRGKGLEFRQEQLEKALSRFHKVDVHFMSRNCPLLLLECTRQMFITAESDWFPFTTGSVFSDLATTTFALGSLEVDPVTIPVENPYRAVLRAELLTRPLSDMLASISVRNRKPGRALITLTAFNTRSSYPFAGFGELPSKRLEEIAYQREEFEESWMSWLESVEKASTGEGSDVALVTSKMSRYRRAREGFLRLMGALAREDRPQGVTVERYKQQCYEGLDLLDQQAREFGVDLLFLGMADSGYLFVHWKPDSKAYCMGEFLKEETRTGLMSFLAGAFAEGDSEAMALKAEALVRCIGESIEMGQKLCIVPIGVVTSLPLAPFLAQYVASEGEEPGSVAQLSDSFFALRQDWKEKDRPLKTYAGFARTEDLPYTGAEFCWDDLGLDGSVQRQFTRNRVLGAMKAGHRVVHLATHGIFDQETPMFSGWLTNDGVIRGWDLIRDRFETELLVINACSGTRGGIFVASSGFGPVQFALARGVRAALSPCAPVKDRSAAMLVTAFQESLGQGSSLADAFYKMVTLGRRSRSSDWRYYTLQGTWLPALFSSPWVR